MMSIKFLFINTKTTEGMSDIFDIGLDSVRENILENMLAKSNIKLEKDHNIAMLTSSNENFILSNININYDLYVNLTAALKGINTLILDSEEVTFDLKDGSMDFKGLNIMFDSIAYYCKDKFTIKSSKQYRTLSNLNILSEKDCSVIKTKGKQIVLNNCNFNAHFIKFEVEPILDNTNLNIKYISTMENDKNKDLIKKIINIVENSKPKVPNIGLPIYKYDGNILDTIKKFVDISNIELFSIYPKNTYKFIVFSKQGHSSVSREISRASFQIMCHDGFLDIGYL